MFYRPTQSQELVEQYSDDLHIEIVPVETMHYVPARDRFMPASEIESQGLECVEYTDAQLKKDLVRRRGDSRAGSAFPKSCGSCARLIRPRAGRALRCFSPGLSGSGKSTLAKIIYAKLLEAGGRPVTLLDGDIVRQHLSSELGFSKEHRYLNVNRIGYVASEITKNRGVAICAPIAPYTLDASLGAGNDRAARRLHRNPCGNATGDLRGPRPQGVVCQGAPGGDTGVYRHQ